MLWPRILGEQECDAGGCTLGVRSIREPGRGMRRPLIDANAAEHRRDWSRNESSTDVTYACRAISLPTSNSGTLTPRVSNN